MSDRLAEKAGVAPGGCDVGGLWQLPSLDGEPVYGPSPLERAVCGYPAAMTVRTPGGDEPACWVHAVVVIARAYAAGAISVVTFRAGEHTPACRFIDVTRALRIDPTGLVDRQRHTSGLLQVLPGGSHGT